MVLKKNSVLGAELTSKQEAEVMFYFDEDPDLWLVLLSEFFRTQGADSEKLKGYLIENPPKWQELVAKVKETHFEDLKTIAFEKTMAWNLRIKQLLSDPGHANLLNYYLRALIALKTKRVVAIGGRGKTQQQINAILSYVANSAFSHLERYSDAAERTRTGLTPSKAPLTPSAISFYQTLYTDTLRDLACEISILLIFKGASSSQDIERLQGLIRQNILKPLQAKALGLNKKSDEFKELDVKIENYQKLLNALNISF